MLGQPSNGSSLYDIPLHGPPVLLLEPPLIDGLYFWCFWCKLKKYIRIK